MSETRLASITSTKTLGRPTKAKSSQREIEFCGNIVAIRAIEDCIRATKKYTEGIETMRNKHPNQYPDSWGNFPSKVFCKYYEVYPETEISWDMPAGVAIDWLWGDTPRVDVVFKYDYRDNKLFMKIKGGNGAVKELTKNIPGFAEALKQVSS